MVTFQVLNFRHHASDHELASSLTVSKEYIPKPKKLVALSISIYKRDIEHVWKIWSVTALIVFISRHAWSIMVSFCWKYSQTNQIKIGSQLDLVTLRHYWLQQATKSTSLKICRILLQCIRSFMIISTGAWKQWEVRQPRCSLNSAQRLD